MTVQPAQFSAHSSILNKHMNDDHKRAVRMFGYALVGGDETSWLLFSNVIRARTTVLERGALTFASLNSLDVEQAEMTAVAAIFGPSAGSPLPPLLNYSDEARFWASLASPCELEYYCKVSFDHMEKPRQTAFLKYSVAAI